jgi:hypothetical protein
MMGWKRGLAYLSSLALLWLVMKEHASLNAELEALRALHSRQQEQLGEEVSQLKSLHLQEKQHTLNAELEVLEVFNRYYRCGAASPCPAGQCCSNTFPLCGDGRGHCEWECLSCSDSATTTNLTEPCSCWSCSCQPLAVHPRVHPVVRTANNASKSKQLFHYGIVFPFHGKEGSARYRRFRV